MSDFSDFFSGHPQNQSTILGALTGGPIGALAGYFSGHGQEEAQKSMGQAKQQLQQLQRQQYAQRMADLNRALSYFSPLQSKFGIGSGQQFGGPQASAPVGGAAPAPAPSVGGFFGPPKGGGR